MDRPSGCSRAHCRRVAEAGRADPLLSAQLATPGPLPVVGVGLQELPLLRRPGADGIQRRGLCLRLSADTWRLGRCREGELVVPKTRQ